MVPSVVLSTPADQPEEAIEEMADDAPDDTPDDASQEVADDATGRAPERQGAARSDESERTGGPARWRPLLALVPAALLVVISVWELVAAQRAGADVPGDDAWAKASETVRARYQDGDLIVFAPTWIDPVGRLHLGDLMPIDHVARMDDARFPVVWELSIRGARAPESRGREVAFSASVGGVRVRKLTRSPAVVLTDFVNQFETSRRQVKTEGRSVGGARVVLEEVGFTPRRCIRVQPRPDDTVRLTFKDVSLGSSLVGHVGLADVFTRRDIRAPGRLAVSVAGEELTSVDFGVDAGWVKFSADTEAGANEQVTFAVTAVGAGARKRLICFAAEARQ